MSRFNQMDATMDATVEPLTHLPCLISSLLAYSIFKTFTYLSLRQWMTWILIWAMDGLDVYALEFKSRPFVPK